MLSDCFNRLNSEDYTEFIFRDNYFSKKTLEEVSDYCVTYLNSKWSIISVRNDLVRDPVYGRFSYAVLPGIYGLSDLGAVSAAGVIKVREQPVLNLKGYGTCVAIIDSGINWRHKAFLNANNTTKIRALWDQDTNMVYDSVKINEALSTGADDIPGDEIGHGTFMAGIACGSEDVNNLFSGVAPAAGLIVVKLRSAKRFLRNFYSVDENIPAYSEADIMRGLQFVSEYIESNRVPASIIIGVGTSLGTHYGYSPLSDMIRDETGKAGRCISVAAGNEGNERLHFKGVTDGINPIGAELRIEPGLNGLTANIWSKAPVVYSLEIISPSGQIAGRFPVKNESQRTFFVFENSTVYVYSRRTESISGANLITIRMRNPAGGIWKFNLYPNIRGHTEADIWVMNRGFLNENTYFIVSDPEDTIVNPGNLVEAITVTAYDYRDDTIYLKNSRGNNWYGLPKPDFAAPGVNMTGPSPIGTDNYEIRSGTSVAAAFYGGIAALLLEYGIVNNAIPYLRTPEIKTITIAGCVQKNNMEYPNKIWGYGMVNILNSLEKLREEL